MTTSPVWREIESAPKDGTRVLVWCVHYNHKFAPDNDKDQWEGPVIANWTHFNGGGWTWHGHTGRFTHWMPLPPPPTQEQTDD